MHLVIKLSRFETPPTRGLTESCQLEQVACLADWRHAAKQRLSRVGALLLLPTHSNVRVVSLPDAGRRPESTRLQCRFRVHRVWRKILIASIVTRPGTLWNHPLSLIDRSPRGYYCLRPKPVSNDDSRLNTEEPSGQNTRITIVVKTILISYPSKI